MTKVQKQNAAELVKQALAKYKSKFKLAFLYTGISYAFSVGLILYCVQVIDRVIGSGNLEALVILLVITILLIYLGALLRQTLIYKAFNNISKSATLEIFDDSAESSTSNISNDFLKLKSFLCSVRVSIILDAVWSVVYFILLFCVHPYVGLAAILGVLLVSGFAYIKVIRTNQNSREVTEFNKNGISWLYIHQQNLESILIVIPTELLIIWSILKYYVINKILKSLDNAYIDKNLSRFFLYLKIFLTISVKLIVAQLILTVGLYIVVNTEGSELTTVDMIFVGFIATRLLGAFDNLVMIWPSTRSAYRSYKNLTSFLKI